MIPQSIRIRISIGSHNRVDWTRNADGKRHGKLAVREN